MPDVTASGRGLISMFQVVVDVGEMSVFRLAFDLAPVFPPPYIW
jgi:hypothetical protein